MGVSGLLSYLLRNSHKRYTKQSELDFQSKDPTLLTNIEFEDIQELTKQLNPLVLDGPNLVHELRRRSGENWWHGGEIQRLSEGTKSWFAEFMEMGFSIVVVFDGGYEPAKVPEKLMRDAQTSEMLQNNVYESTKCPPSGPISPLSWGVVIRAISDLAGVELMFAEGEADSAIVLQALDRGGTVLTNDTDLLFMAAQLEKPPKIIFQNCTIDNTEVIYDLDTELQHGHLTMWSPQNLTKQLGLTKLQSTLLAAVVGNDFTKCFKQALNDVVDPPGIGRSKGHFVQKATAFVTHFDSDEDCERAIQKKLGSRWSDEMKKTFFESVAFYFAGNQKTALTGAALTTIEGKSALQAFSTGWVDRNVLSGVLFGEAVFTAAAEDPKKSSIWSPVSLKGLRALAYGLMMEGDTKTSVREHYRASGKKKTADNQPVLQELSVKLSAEERAAWLALKPKTKLRKIAQWVLLQDDTDAGRGKVDTALKQTQVNAEVTAIVITAIALRASALVAQKCKADAEAAKGVLHAVASALEPGAKHERHTEDAKYEPAYLISARRAVAHWSSQFHAFLSILLTVSAAVNLPMERLHVPDGSRVFRIFLLQSKGQHPGACADQHQLLFEFLDI